MAFTELPSASDEKAIDTKERDTEKEAEVDATVVQAGGLSRPLLSSSFLDVCVDWFLDMQSRMASIPGRARSSEA